MITINKYTHNKTIVLNLILSNNNTMKENKINKYSVILHKNHTLLLIYFQYNRKIIVYLMLEKFQIHRLRRRRNFSGI